MANLVLPDPRMEMPELLTPGVKPVGNVVVDRSHPLARGLVTYCLYNKSTKTQASGDSYDITQWRDLAGKAVPLQATGGGGDNGATGGPHYRHVSPVADYTYISIPLTGVSFSAGFTLVLGSNKLSGSVPWSITSGSWNGIYTDANNKVTSVAAADWGGVGEAIATSFARPTQVGGIYTQAISLSTASKLRISSNGGAVSVSTNNPIPSGTFSKLHFGGNGFNSANNATLNVSDVMIFNRALSSAELQSISYDPYQLLIPA